jgi:uncharacterized protein (DUF433 family)
MDTDDRIAMDPRVMVGQPVIRGTRLTVAFIVSLLKEGWTREDVLRNYPHLTADDLEAAMKYPATRS